jgi:hypothetical protein
MDYTKMLFAAQVHDLAIAYRRSEMPDELDPADEPSFDAWISAHPISQYVPDALQAIRNTALQIEAITSQST